VLQAALLLRYGVRQGSACAQAPAPVTLPQLAAQLATQDWHLPELLVALGAPYATGMVLAWLQRCALAALRSRLDAPAKGACSPAAAAEAAGCGSALACQAKQADQPPGGRLRAELAVGTAAAAHQARLAKAPSPPERPGAAYPRLMAQLAARQGTGAMQKPAAHSSLYSSDLQHVTAVAKYSTRGRPGRAAADAGDSRQQAAAYAVDVQTALRVTERVLERSSPLALRCVAFPGCVAVAAQVSWGAHAAPPSAATLRAALEQQLRGEDGMKLLAADVAALEDQLPALGADGSGGDAAGFWCMTPAVLATSSSSTPLRLWVPAEVVSRLAAAGECLRVVLAAAGSSPLADVRIPVADAAGAVSLELPPCATLGRLVTIMVFASASRQRVQGQGQQQAQRGEQQAQQPAPQQQQHGSDRLLATLPLLVLPTSTAVQEVDGLWYAMLAEWLEGQPGTPLEQASGGQLPLSRGVWCAAVTRHRQPHPHRWPVRPPPLPSPRPAPLSPRTLTCVRHCALRLLLQAAGAVWAGCFAQFAQDLAVLCCGRPAHMTRLEMAAAVQALGAFMADHGMEACVRMLAAAAPAPGPAAAAAAAGWVKPPITDQGEGRAGVYPQGCRAAWRLLGCPPIAGTGRPHPHPCPCRWCWCCRTGGSAA
jgi:hypothetical protein